MSANATSLLGPEAVDAFAARGIGTDDAAALIERAKGELSVDELRAAVRTLAETRLLTWAECLRYVVLRRPVV